MTIVNDLIRIAETRPNHRATALYYIDLIANGADVDEAMQHFVYEQTNDHDIAKLYPLGKPPKSIQVSLSPAFINKQEKMFGELTWSEYQTEANLIAKQDNGDDDAIEWHGNDSMTYSFKCVDMSLKGFTDAISKKGLSWAVGVYDGVMVNNTLLSHRHKDYFIGSWVLALDFDEGTPIKDIINDPFIARYMGFLHASPSHTLEHPKVRVIFFLERPVTDADEWESYQTGLIKLVEYLKPDVACRNASRKFFGSTVPLDAPNNVRSLSNYNVSVPISVCEMLAKRVEYIRKAEHEARMAIRRLTQTRRDNVVTDERARAYEQSAIEGELSKLRLASSGSRNATTLQVACTLISMAISTSWELSEIEAEQLILDNAPISEGADGFTRQEVMNAIKWATKNVSPREMVL